MGECKLCKSPQYSSDSCSSHVHWLQKHGSTCQQALQAVGRPPPQDCGCTCDDLTCEEPASSEIYLDSCHGRFKVLSRRAAAKYADVVNEKLCPQRPGHGLERCLTELDIRRIHEKDVVACGGGGKDLPCGSTAVAFYPYKSIKSWFDCWGYANKFGHGPVNVGG